MPAPAGDADNVSWNGLVALNVALGALTGTANLITLISAASGRMLAAQPKRTSAVGPRLGR